MWSVHKHYEQEEMQIEHLEFILTLAVILPVTHTNQMLTFLPQLHNRLGKGQECHIENNQEETEAQGPRHCEGRHQDSPQRLLLQLFHTARG